MGSFSSYRGSASFFKDHAAVAANLEKAKSQVREEAEAAEKALVITQQALLAEEFMDGAAAAQAYTVCAQFTTMFAGEEPPCDAVRELLAHTDAALRVGCNISPDSKYKRIKPASWRADVSMFLTMTFFAFALAVEE